MDGYLHGIQPKGKMEDDLKKANSIIDELIGRQAQWMTTSMKDNLTEI